MKKLLVTVQGDKISPAVIRAGTRGSYSVTDLDFNFSPEWDGLHIKIIFYPLRGTPVYCVYKYGTVRIPAKLMRYDGTALMSISGFAVRRDGKLDRKIITESAEIVVDSVPSDTLCEPDIPSATAFEGIVAKLGAPYIGANGNWFIWDTESHEFFDSGLPSRGIQGEVGQGLRVLGHYDSLDVLRAAVTDAVPGDAYSVGVELPYPIYIFDVVTMDWRYHGVLKGNGIKKIEQITFGSGSGSENVVRFYMEDEYYYDITVRNGASGERGVPGNIYIGADTPPDDAYIWLYPDGKAENVLRVRVGDQFVVVPAVRGDDGKPFTYDDFTPEQLAALKGKSFTYDDFTPEQLAALKGAPGKTPVRGEDYWTPDDIASIKAYIDYFIERGEW